MILQTVLNLHVNVFNAWVFFLLLWVILKSLTLVLTMLILLR